MALKVNCDGYQRDHYFSRAWALITQDQGWIKPVLLLTLAQLIPIVGPLGVSGYTVEWARLIAWNVNAAPKQRGVNVGECVVSGWRTFLVCLGWGILGTIAFMLIALVPLFGALLVFAATIFCLYLEQLLRVACLRASIYQQLGAGYKASRIWEMGERDVEGLIRIIGIDFIGQLIISIIMTIVASVVMVAMVPVFIEFAQNMGYISSVPEQELIDLVTGIINVIVSFMPIIIIISLVGSFLATLLNMVVMGAIGLWMRQFNVPAWGRSDDPLPQPLPETFVAYQTAPNAQYPHQDYGYAQQAPTQQYGYAQQQAPTQQYGYAQQDPTQQQTPAQQYAYGQQAPTQQFGYPEQQAPTQSYGYVQQQVPAQAYLPQGELTEAHQTPSQDPSPQQAFVPPAAEQSVVPEVAPTLELEPQAAPETAPTLELEPQAAPDMVSIPQAETEIVSETTPAPEIDPVPEITPETESTLDMPRPVG